MATLSFTVLSAKPTADGKFPIFLRINVGSEKQYIRTKYVLDDCCQWYKGQVVARADAAQMNRRLKYELKRYKERMEDIEGHEVYPARQLKAVLEQMDKVVPNTTTFNDFYRRRIEGIRQEGRASYAKMMDDTLRLFEKAEGTVPMCIMNHITVEHFDRWLRQHGHTDGGRQLRLCHIKARVNDAIKLGLIHCTVHPFAYTKLPSPKPREMDISPENVRRIIQADVSSSRRLTLARDMFLLSFYLGGINFADLIRADFSGSTICYVRQKVAGNGGHEVKLTIQPEASAIINKYIGKNGRLKFDYKYSDVNLQRYINQCLKLLASELGIHGCVSFYSARKSFAQMAAELGISDAVIDYCLGHSDRNRGTIRFYTKVRQKQADIAVRRVIDYALNPSQFQEYIELRMQVMMGLVV